MPANEEFHHFVQSWLRKAREIQLTDLNAHFDRFFTLYVVYNRLYAEATFILARQGSLDLSRRTSFPDKEAATRYVCQFIGACNLVDAFSGDTNEHRALQGIVELVDTNVFSIRLHMITGDRQRDKDQELLADLRSTSRNTKAVAILETIYAIRCNMFHGHKEFHPIQVEILAPAIVIMEKVISLLHQKIENG